MQWAGADELEEVQEALEYGTGALRGRFAIVEKGLVEGQRRGRTGLQVERGPLRGIAGQVKKRGKGCSSGGRRLNWGRMDEESRTQWSIECARWQQDCTGTVEID